MSKKPWRAGKDLSSVVENMEIGTGQRGDGKDAFVTQRQLAELKLARLSTGAGGKVNLKPGTSLEATLPPPAFPSRPKNFKATGGFGSVLLEWDMPRYRGHSLTEIWRGTEDNLADAVLVATTPGQVYGDPVDPGWKGFYWIRFVNQADVAGPWNDTTGTGAETQANIDSIIDTIQEQINESPIVKNLDEMWSLKAKAGDIKVGIGLVAQEDGTTQIGLAAGNVFIFDPNSPDDQGKYAIPFAVVDGRVVIDEAVMREATIKILNAQHIVADEVKAGIGITSPFIRSGTIQNGNFQVDSSGNMNAVNANLNNVTSRGGIFYDLIANRGEMNNITINENCIVKGTVFANKILGDVIKIVLIPQNGSTLIPAESFGRRLAVPCVSINGWTYSGGFGIGGGSATITASPGGSFLSVSTRHLTATGSGQIYIPAGQTTTLTYTTSLDHASATPVAIGFIAKEG